MSFKKKFYKDIATLGSYNYLSQIVNFLSTIIVSRFLLPKEYGVVALITVFSGFVKMFADAGLSYEVIRTDYKQTYYRAINNLSLYVGIMLFLLMVALAYPIALFYNDMKLIIPTIIMSLIFIPQTLNTVPSAILSKRLEFKIKGTLDFINNIIIVGLTILLAYLGASYWALIIPQLLGCFLLYVAFSIKADFKFQIKKYKYTKIGFRKTKGLIGNMSGFNLINYWARNADKLLVGKFYGGADLGIYNRSYRFINLSLTMLTQLFGSVLLPSFKKLISEGKKLDKEYYSILGIISLLNYPIALILIGIPNYFVLAMWGKNWIDVAGLIPYFGVLILSQTLISTTGQVFVLIKKEKTLFLLGSFSAIIMITAIVLGVLSSLVDVARYYAVSYVGIVIPLYLYFGFYKSFEFPINKVLIFWIPKIILSLSLIITIWLDMELIKDVLIGLYGIHLIINQYNDIKKLFQAIKTKFIKSISNEQ